MAQSSQAAQGRFSALVYRLCEYWALLGGLLLLIVVLINGWSIVSGALMNKPFPGDYELTEYGVAVAIFCFLPWCQISGSNVSADIFTERASPRAINIMKQIGVVVAIIFSAVLLWRMSAGLLDYREYEEATGLLQIPLWWGFVPALFSLFLVALAALVNLLQLLKERQEI